MQDTNTFLGFEKAKITQISPIEAQNEALKP